MELRDLGWDDRFERVFEPFRANGLTPARISRRTAAQCTTWGEHGEGEATIAGRLVGTVTSEAMLPTVGDWVAQETLERAHRIHAVVPRRTCFSRRAAGRAEREQVLAANVDMVFLVTGLDRDFNPRRIERYLMLADDSGARPVIILNKADLCPERDERCREVQSLAGDAPVHVTCGLDRESLAAVAGYLQPGCTIALLGSSGVGKSTIINGLLGTGHQSTGAVRSLDGRGRHTTTARELMMVPGGGLVIDTPGLREVQLWLDASAMPGAFEEIDDLARGCRFRDCRHEGEPGCAVEQALEDGELDEARLESFRKLRREIDRHASRTTEQGRREARAELRAQGRMYKRVQRGKRRRREKGW
ncbi:MAG: ribosome small subunit-dependent GTPase A [Planctomycetota bacterium]|jgi:ribosome biogenesis GTPase